MPKGAKKGIKNAKFYAELNSVEKMPSQFTKKLLKNKTKTIGNKSVKAAFFLQNVIFAIFSTSPPQSTVTTGTYMVSSNSGNQYVVHNTGTYVLRTYMYIISLNVLPCL
jgi:hypothetical protein